MCLKRRHANFQRYDAKGTFLNLRLNGGGKKMYVFNGKLAISRKRWKIRLAKVNINH